MIDSLSYRVLQISKAHRLGHLSSNLTAVGIIDEIYSTMRPTDAFVLSAGHCSLAHFVCLEKHEGQDAEALYLKHRTHSSRNMADGIHVSNGSLGCAVTVALGMAMADCARDVYCLTSDGECAEGAIWETLNLRAIHGVHNLHVYVNLNGWSCLGATFTARLRKTLTVLDDTIQIRDTRDTYSTYPFLRGVEGHYHNLTDADWAWVEANR